MAHTNDGIDLQKGIMPDGDGLIEITKTMIEMDYGSWFV
jgi:hypothetical protein